MRQFIQYLYEYGQGRRIRNVGFVKAELDEESSTLHIHGKGLRLTGETSLVLYLFYEDGGRCIGIRQGEIQNINPAVNYQLRYTKDDVGVPENYERICGVVLVSQVNQRFAATWNGAEVPIEQMQVWEEAQVEEEPAQVDIVEPGNQDDFVDMSCVDVTEEMRETSREDESQEDVPADEAVCDPEEDEFDPEEELYVETEQAGCEPIEKEHSWKITKIQRNEISILPRCEWRLANNNFLLHGYYNYRHLVLLDDGNVLKLGVPGIYHDKEARAAAAFGFPEFVGEEDIRLTLEPEECNQGQQFGYWCRQVKRPMI